MKMTVRDLIHYLEQNGFLHSVVCDIVYLHGWCEFSGLNEKFTELPDNVHFMGTCDFSDSYFTSIPDSIILNQSIYIKNTKLSKLPVLNLGGHLYLFSDIDIAYGTYVGTRVYSDDPTINALLIRGYFVCDGVLS